MEAAGENPAEINMGLTEILLIVFGILAFVGSFVIPENLAGKTSEDVKVPEEKIKELIAKEVKQAEYQIEEKTDETISAAAEKAERYMERLSNEKIMAIQEYSDTVLNQINKNHDEAVFLYDMLNNKYAQVKNTAAEFTTQVQDVKADIEQTLQEQLSVDIISSSTEEVKAHSIIVDRTNAVSGESETREENKMTKIQEAKKNNVNKDNIVEEKSEIEIQFDPDSDMGTNKYRILELHKEGKSNMAIAKSLGLGIGEVKLIIDLFESGK